MVAGLYPFQNTHKNEGAIPLSQGYFPRGKMGKEIEGENQSVDDRSAMAKAMDKVSFVMGACFAFAIPIVLGYFLDQKFKTGVLFTLLGFLLGMAAGSWQLYKLIQKINT